MMRVEDFLRDSGLRLGAKPALVDGAVSLTASEIEPFSARMAAALAGNGIRRGDRVLVFMDSCWEAVVSILGILMVGAVAVPVDAHATDAELAAMLNESGAAGLATQSRLARTTAAAMAAAPNLRLTVIAGCEGAPEIDGILRFEDAIAEKATLPDAAAAAGAGAVFVEQMSDTLLGRSFSRFVAAVGHGATYELDSLR